MSSKPRTPIGTENIGSPDGAFSIRVDKTGGLPDAASATKTMSHSLIEKSNARVTAVFRDGRIVAYSLSDREQSAQSMRELNRVLKKGIRTTDTSGT